MSQDISASLDFVSADLYRFAANSHGSGNFVLSPFSILYASMMLYLGSSGPTKDSFTSALHLPKLGEGTGALKDIFQTTVKALPLFELSDPVSGDDVQTTRSPPHTKRPTDIALLNGIFFDQSLNVNQSFKKDVEKFLHGTVSVQNFTGNPAAARTAINSWVSSNTLGNVVDLVPDGTVTTSSKVVLANTLFFKANWNLGFPARFTGSKPFFSLDGKVTEVPMMVGRRTVPYAEDNVLDVQYIELAYADDFFMAIVLPRQKDGLQALERNFSTNSLRDLRAKVDASKAGFHRVVDIQIPKFKIETKFELGQLLTTAGVNLAFGDDFSAMATGGFIALSDSYHNAVIEIDEWGTKAAAVSAPQTANSEIILDDDQTDWTNSTLPVDFTVNHPFLFTIQHRPSQAILFTGRVESF